MNTELMDPEKNPVALAILKRCEEVIVNIKIVKILNSQAYAAAADYRIRVNRELKALEADRKNLTAPLLQIKRMWDDWFSQRTSGLENVKNTLDRAILDYENEDRKKREEAERKAREEAKKQEESERKRLEAQAKKAQDKGNVEKANELRDQAESVYVAPKPVAERLPETKLQTRDNWTYEVENEALIPREFLVPDYVAIGRVARSTKGKILIPGIRIFNDPIKAG